MALSSLISKYFEEVVECFNEIKCAIFFISHTYVCVIFYIAHLGVQYEIYTLAFPFDLRCQSGILQYYPILNCRAHLHEGSKCPIYLGIHTYNTFKSALLCFL